MPIEKNAHTVQGLIQALRTYWIGKNCTTVHPVDAAVGAGTFHPVVFFSAVGGSHPLSVFYLQTVRRPSDGREGKGLNRLQQHHQFQVVLKPSCRGVLDSYIDSLKKVGFSLQRNDVRLLEDNWENPTLGAWGTGWEVWMNGMEITQLTFFQRMGGVRCRPVVAEITYGIERMAMCLQKVRSVYDLVWDRNEHGNVTYGTIFLQNEQEQSRYNFRDSDVLFLTNCLRQYENEARRLLKQSAPLLIPAYEQVLRMTHAFNLLDARRIFSASERQKQLLDIRALTKKIARTYLNENRR